ncbi:flavin reductase family protein [Oceanobacillus sojae]|uniref:Flavin reductase like domain-containing protein n=1 Tax=Oceanobacillus sojae TaxID=582851 RepID=A0A511ZCX8_9BACI|nr:flavin reductase family protein [Oceanobacillus sojae]GEN85281.1 hypothetical protein OSO01_00200 [Oceanobacillus sojae]
MLIDPTKLSEKELYKLLIGSVLPRPIAWVSTKSKEGILNLSPFSFFNVASSKPPIFSISISPGTEEREGSVKDTLQNIRDTKEFVINLVNASLAEAMKTSSENLPPEMDEFQKSGVTPVESTSVVPPWVKESPINMECKLYQIIPLGSDYLVLGELQQMHIQDAYFDNGYIDIKRLKALGRLAGNYIVADKIIDLSDKNRNRK